MPDTSENTPSARKGSKAPVIPLTRQLQEFIAESLRQEGPPGCTIDSFKKVAAGISAAKGTSVSEKVLEYWKSLEGSIKEGPDTYHPMVQGSTITFTDAKRSIITHFSIIGKMYEEAYATSNFKTLNVTSPLFQENLQATLLLKFNSAKFSLATYHPNMANKDKLSTIKLMLGECEQMDWQKKSYEALSDEQDQQNFITLKRILNHIWVPLATIGFTGLGNVIKEFITGLDQWGERACGSSQVMEAVAQLEHDANQARTLAMADRTLQNNSNRLPKFTKSAELTRMLTSLNSSSRVELQRAYSMQAKANALYGQPNQKANKPASSRMDDLTKTELLTIMSAIKKESNATPRAKPAAKQTSPSSVTFEDTAKPNSSQIMRSKNTLWTSKFGTKTVKGKKLILCWFRCNHPDGCKKGATCQLSHQAYPDAYKSKPFAKLAADTQWSIIKACTKEA
jgi:hypothetical protein